MKRFEFQGKELFSRAGIAIPQGQLVRIMNPDGTPLPDGSPDLQERLGAAINELAHLSSGKTSRLVVKAQLDMGGRGKAGLIRIVGGNQGDPDELAQETLLAVQEMLEGGHTIPAILLEEAVPFNQELYISISVDALGGGYVLLASAEGGVDIETLAEERPHAIKRVFLDPLRGILPYQARGLAYDLGLQGDMVRSFADLATRLYSVFIENDAELAEINPLFVRADGKRLVAGDAKVIIDDNSLYRHPEFQLLREQYESDPAFEAALEGIPYLQFDGTISLMCAGAGLATTVFDLVNYEGGSVANYLEFGGPNYNKAQRAMELCLKNKSKVILIVTFGTIARADVMAKGVVEAVKNLNPDRPIVTCLRGTNEEEADATLRAAGLEPLYDTEVAVRKAVALAGGKA
ncbi:succinyl-CoA synthetase (ADP-forming) beta subunit [Alkalispirochaeta americana]|uniref:Succinyl-CoA synthetase (ADP-forming) beta subunit n=1 Tax=Alkalispirochaeta americana TaxID=159291 RepID=A0A1N6VE55_9SPIO|nr:succinate--CoA ligase subunit beta [Alkalispirochaeta americana]SIQ76132.1 succinyl-CoA synthetase (ADP-forming) beta subunit [Alkalispirochaeta americana]